ncbi:hypothetical protein KFE25_008807 [Diacronema lutheri]|uniref:Macro domain-containing protein n=1 Tax=Diacronema lutheri TaxID=2081491 RepID=A0A8J5XWL3_DIALT|nr:hypothetical protein KFE25_008807 [Diacronema lutheri]
MVIDLDDETIDLCDDDAGSEAHAQAAARGVAGAPTPQPFLALRAPTAGIVRQVALPGGVVDPTICAHASAIAQQLNCIGVDGRGLAAAVAAAFPYADVYAGRERSARWGVAAKASFSRPGSIDVRRPRSGSGPIVVNMFAQWEMGASFKYKRVPAPGSMRDSRDQREIWFQEGLDAIASMQPRLDSIAFPHQIGCGLGGGIWEHYEKMIRMFAARQAHIDVVIVTRCGGGGRGTGGRGTPAPRTGGKRARDEDALAEGHGGLGRNSRIAAFFDRA